MKQIIIIVLILISIKIQAQTPQWQWINVGGGNGNPHSNFLNLKTKQIGTDAHGNVYGIASTSGDISIDTLSPLNGILYDDFVVFSYTCDGQFRWIQLFGSVGDDILGGIVVQPNGDVYVGGTVGVSYWGTAHFADSIIPATNNMKKGYFMAKLDSTGHLTHLNLPGPPTSVVGALPMRMESDKYGNPVVLTWFSDSATWNGHHINGRGHYLVKFDKNCNLTDIVELDLKFNNGVSNYEWMEFTIDKQDNSIFLYSNVPDTVFICNDTLGINPNNQYHGIGFISKIDFNTGQILWHTDVNGYAMTDSSQFIGGKAVIQGSNVYLEGVTQSYSGSAFLGIPINNPIASVPHKRTKVFASFDKNTGNIINAINIKSVDNIIRAPIDIQDNNLIAAPNGGGMVILNISDTLMLGINPFVVSLDTGLTYYDWGTAARLLLSNTHLTPTYLHVDHNNNILLGGGLTGPIVNSYGDTTNLVASAENFCIAKIALTNDSCGCAASVPSITVVSSSGNTLTVKGSATNQPDSLYIFWGDGDSTRYTASTNASHTYATGGPWNVCLIAYGFCGIEDTCMNNLYSGIYPTENTIKLMMNVYPNPFNDRLNIELTKSINNGEIYIFDMLGKQVYYNQFSGKQLNINTSELIKGFYFIKLTLSEGSVIVKKLVKN